MTDPVPSAPAEIATDGDEAAAGEIRTNLGLFAALAAFLLPTLFLPSVSAPFWAPKMALLLVVAAVGLVVLARPPAAEARAATWAARAFLLVAAASSLLSATPALAVVGLWNQGTGLVFLVGCVGAWAIGQRLNAADRSLLVRALVAAVLVNVAVVILAMTFDLSAIGFARFLGRGPGLLQSPVFVGPLMTAGLALLAGWVRPRPTVILPALLAIGVGLGLSGGRGAALLVLPVAAWAWRRHGWHVAVPILAVVAMGVVVAPLVDRPPAAEAARAGVEAAQVDEAPAAAPGSGLLQRRPLSPRFATWWSARHAVAANPVVGAGPGQFRAATIAYRPDVVASDTPDGYFTDAHNFLVEHAVTTGLAGLAALAVWLLLAARWARGPLAVFAAVVGIAHLFQPENAGTTPLALLALGAASAARFDSGLRKNLPRPVTAAAGVAALLGALLFLFGAHQLAWGTARFDLAAATRSDRILGAWPQPAHARGVINQYSFASGNRRAAAAALDAFLAAAQRDPSNPKRWSLLGEVASSHGEWATARRAFARALKLDPSSPQTQRGIARLEALQAAQRAAG